MAEKEYIDLYECRDDFYATVLDILSEDSTNDRANQIIDAFDYLPTANVAPVRHGEWANEETAVTCTACGRSYDTDFEIKRNVIMNFKYCPKCGARMDGGEQK